MENHYGVDGIEGPTLLEVGKKQASKFGAEFIQEEVANVSKGDGHLVIETADQKSYQSQHVILATGASVSLAESIGVTVKPGTEPRIKSVVDVDASGKTNLAGVWAAGTCAGVSVHTIITAGDGAKVAINIISELNGARYVDHDMMKKE